MAKRYDEMTSEELDAWYERHQRLRGVRAVLILLIVFAIAGAAWFALRVWRQHSEALFRAEQQRQLDELRGIEVQQNAAGAEMGSPCVSLNGTNCAGQSETAAPHTVDASTSVAPR